MKLRVIRYFGAFAAILFISVNSSWAAEEGLPTQPQPRITVEGEHGNAVGVYWVMAQDKNGRLTAPTNPTIVRNLPMHLDKKNHVLVTPVPVPGAVKYLILKTIPMTRKIAAKVTPANAGDKKFYYWIQWSDDWRESALSGPFAVSCKESVGNVIEWQPIPNASWYQVFRTPTPAPPLGRGFFEVARQIGAAKKMSHNGAKTSPLRLKDKGWLGQAVCGNTVPPLDQPPAGTGLWLLGRTSGSPVSDLGQPLKVISVPNLNQTKRVALTGPAANQTDITGLLGSQYLIRTDNRLKHLRMPSFSAGHLETLVVENRVYSGGHSEYHKAPYGPEGWKSWISAIAARVVSHTASQHGALTSNLDVYGSGDAIPISSIVNMYGSNNDAGDEGAYSTRNDVRRRLNAYDGRLRTDAPRGSQWLKLEHLDFNGAGTERLVVNTSRAYQQGRIIRVNNIDIYGKNTNWTNATKGQWISFDVDTVMGGGKAHFSAASIKGGYRMWYWITEVKSTTHLKILAKTGWSSSCNLGYSRFIWNPETATGPTPRSPNASALKYLPKDREAAARAGGYRICPGVQLADGWKKKHSLHVEPLTETWSKGENIRIVAGPQTYLSMARFMLGGDFLPQDVIGGISINNRGSRQTNFAAIQIGNPGFSNFREGIRITLPKNGTGDGLVISAATGWDKAGFAAGNSGTAHTAIVVPDNLPGIVGEHPWRYPHIRWEFSQKGTNDALVIGMQKGVPAARFDRNGTVTVKNLKLKGSFVGNRSTRGKALFNGDGKKTAFSISFGRTLPAEPFVTISTNQFAVSRLAAVRKNGLTVEFRTPPVPGKNNVVIYWLAQE